ncbi:hypothetical protein HYFRA_00000194 [Hymenoscyphus fraxineus]|uniref:CUE domain-containing protein n=1 Tax=Hymenoscyphus fraxineus TaxID=746836 RepID=A0A9N9L1P7_9HELO|nr:hypothetical protein HYFRA_00000194 [Hymenoscyphus fraxineus]
MAETPSSASFAQDNDLSLVDQLLEVYPSLGPEDARAILDKAGWELNEAAVLVLGYPDGGDPGRGAIDLTTSPEPQDNPDKENQSAGNIAGQATKLNASAAHGSNTRSEAGSGEVRTYISPPRFIIAEDADDADSGVQEKVEYLESLYPQFLQSLLLDIYAGNVKEMVRHFDGLLGIQRDSVDEKEEFAPEKGVPEEKKGRKRDLIEMIEKESTQGEAPFKKPKTGKRHDLAAERIRIKLGGHSTGAIIVFQSGQVHELKFDPSFFARKLPGLSTMYTKALPAFRDANPNNKDENPDIRLAMPDYLRIEAFNLLIYWCATNLSLHTLSDVLPACPADQQLDILLEAALFGESVSSAFGWSTALPNTIREILSDSRGSLQCRHLEMAFSATSPLTDPVQKVLVEACFRGFLKHRSGNGGGEWEFAGMMGNGGFKGMLLEVFTGAWWERDEEVGGIVDPLDGSELVV